MEQFLWGGITLDHVPVAVCGFCDPGWAGPVRHALDALRSTRFGPYTAAFTVDYRLDGLLRGALEPVSDHVRMMGVSAGVPGADGTTGGILGGLSGAAASAGRKCRREGPFLVGMIPGMVGFALRSNEDEPELTGAFLAMEGQASCPSFYQRLKASGKEFVFIADGSGPRARGFAATGGAVLPLDMVRHSAEENQRVSGAKRIGVLGGNFDPIHYGHLTVAEAARDALGLDLVLLLPAGRTAYKAPGGATPEQRGLMAYLAARDHPFFHTSTLETQKAGISYTVDTIKELRARCGPSAELYFIIGSDAAGTAPRWKGASELGGLCRFAVAHRPGGPPAERAVEELRRYGMEAVWIDTPGLQISSSDIRARRRTGRPIRYLLPEPVERFIEYSRLYLYSQHT